MPNEDTPPQIAPAERDRLARRGLRLVDAEARRCWHRYRQQIDLDELRSIGGEALSRALAKYDPRRGRFEGFALARIRGAMKDEARKRRRRQKWRPTTIAARRPADRVARPLRPHGTRDGKRHIDSLLEHRHGDPGVVVAGGDLSESAICDRPDPERSAMAQSEAQNLHRALAVLTRRQRRLIERYYFESVPIGHLATDLGVSRHAARRLHDGSLATMRRALRRHELRAVPRPARRRRVRATRAETSQGPSAPR